MPPFCSCECLLASPYTVQIINIALIWILYPLHFILLSLIQKTWTFFIKPRFILLQFVRIHTLFRGGLDILFNVLPSPIDVLVIVQILQSCRPVCNLNLILFPNLWILVLNGSRSEVLCFYAHTARSTFPHVYPSSCWIIFSPPTVSNFRKFSNIFIWDEIAVSRPTPHPKVTRYPFFLGCHLWPVWHARPNQQLLYRQHSSQCQLTT